MKDDLKMAQSEKGMVFLSTSPEAPDRARVGNKAFNLWRLGNSGLRVPQWFVIPHETFPSFFERPPVEVMSFTEKSNDTFMNTFVEELLRVGQETLASLVDKVLKNSFKGVSLFSVRSSAVDEDSKQSSFAGIMDSYLFVHREDLVNKIAKCAGSPLSKKAIAYRRAHGIPPWPLRIAVIIQEMIRSEKSGVLFSRDPVRNGKAWVISAGFGVGEGIVSNRVETDTFWLDPDSGNVLGAEIVTKRSKMTESDTPREGAVLASLRETTAPVLTPQEIQSLFEMTKTVHAVFNEPLDIEWAFDASGNLYVLQARPITSSTAGPSEVTVWDNSNIVESYPGVSTPLTYSFARHVYENVMKRTALGLTLNRRAIEDHSAIFETLIGYIDGRIYYNLTNWYSMVSLNPALARDKTACNRMLGIKEKLAVTEHTVASSYLSYMTLLWKFFLRNYYRRRFYREFEKWYAEYSSVDFSSYSANDLYALFRKMEARLFRIWPITLENDLFLMFFYDRMTRSLIKAGFRMIRSTFTITSFAIQAIWKV